MATPQKEPLRAVTAAEHTRLDQVAKASSERADRVRRATALLAVVHGPASPQPRGGPACGAASTVTALVARFNRQGLAALTIAAGRGRKPTYDPAARAQIVATAQRAPERKADGTATWSLSTLERTLRREAFPRAGSHDHPARAARGRAVPTSRPGPGARPGRPSASARAASCG